MDKIIPFPRCWTPPGFELIGFVTSLDGGKAGYGSTTHALAEKTEMEKLNHFVPTPLNNGEEEAKEEKPEHFVPTPPCVGVKEVEEGNETAQNKETLQGNTSEKEEEELLRSLAITRSKISKRNVVSHEVLAGKLSAEGLYSLLQPLAFDFWNKPLLLPFKIDSTCFLAMLNPQLELKSMLLTNAVESLKEEILKISIQFPLAMISIGHISGDLYPADIGLQSCQSGLFVFPDSQPNS